MTNDWKIRAFAFATTSGLAYVLCVIFDALFPPYGLVATMSRNSPFPLEGNPAGYLAGLALFVVTGFALGAIYGGAAGFWSKRLPLTRCLL